MENTFITTGLACLIAAIVGGGLKFFGIELPVLKSVLRQIVLGCFGLILILASQLFQDSGKLTCVKVSVRPKIKILADCNNNGEGFLTYDWQVDGRIVMEDSNCKEPHYKVNDVKVGEEATLTISSSESREMRLNVSPHYGDCSNPYDSMLFWWTLAYKDGLLVIKPLKGSAIVIYPGKSGQIIGKLSANEPYSESCVVEASASVKVSKCP